MSGISAVRIPRFMEGQPLPEGYNEALNPYKNPPNSKYNLRAMVNYALQAGKKVPELTVEEVEQFLITSAE